MQKKEDTRRTPQEKRERRRVFLCSFWAAFCVLLVLVGLVVVDCRGRSMSFGEPRVPLQVQANSAGKTTLFLHLFGREKEFDMTAFQKICNFFCDFCCIPHK